jgi:phosphoglycerol transferase MdoB-like AlkP superfamily enzyme
MFKQIPQDLKQTILKLLLVMLMYQVIRLVFFWVNHSFFNEVDFSQYFKIILFSIRFDASIVFAINLPFIVFSLLPFSIVKTKTYSFILNMCFVFSNCICFIFDLADIGYYPYVRKRMTSEVFDLIGKKSDFLDLLPNYAIEFWYVIVFVLLMLAFFVYLNNKINKSLYYIDNQFIIKKYIILKFVFLALSILVIRGGVQLKPIQTINALVYVNNTELPLVVNTPFSIAHSFAQKKLKSLQYFSEQEMQTYFNPIKNYSSSKAPNKVNVVMIILESFGKSYTGLGGRMSYTPFLDSLMQKSLLFSNAYANAFRSSDGIPACVAGIPHFMEEAFATSSYATNKIDALPNLLKKIGYSSAFFHGGTNGTMSFDAFASHAGFDHYFGRTEYDNDKDYDGTWGIWDEPFLQYAIKTMDQQKQPFFNTIFTLSSHEPFGLPKDFKNETIRKLSGINRGISYTDEALKQFFKIASSKPWYKNTLFVITADHNFLASIDSLQFYTTKLGLFSIPVLFFQPGKTPQAIENKTIFQQIDLMPTILDYIHFPSSFFAYGKSGFDMTQAEMAYCLIDKYNYMIANEYAVAGYEENIDGIYHFKTDSFLVNKLRLTDSSAKQTINLYKAYKQMINNTILENRQSVETYQRGH